MNKILNIAWKDLLTTFRDPGALALMLVTPFALTLVIAFAFGRLTGGSGGSGLSDIPVVIVNHDSGEFGVAMVEVFQSEELAELVAPTAMDDDAAARATVENDEAAAVVVIPEGFSESILPLQTLFGGLSDGDQDSVVEIYGNPARPISAGVVRAIVDEALNWLVTGSAGGQVAVTQLVANGLISPQEAQSLGPGIGERVGRQVGEADLIAVQGQTPGEDEANDYTLDVMAYMAPSMAILFLMFNVTAGGRSILTERSRGTLPRMLTTSTTAAQVLAGKMSGVYFTGLAQVTILIAASGLLFGVGWGPPLPLVLVVLALVAAATSWGILIAAYSRTPGQANAIGTAITLVFGGLAGHFFDRQALPDWVLTLSYATPNGWGLEAFTELALGGDLVAVAPHILALLAMSLVLFLVSIVAFRRQYG